MKYTLTLIIPLFLFSQQISAQGCVAIRSLGGLCTMDHGTHSDSSKSKWQFAANNRYFKSFRHFVGDIEQKQRQELGTEVINYAYALDLSLTRIINDRWSIGLSLPFNSNVRSSLYEHGGKIRSNTQSVGLGDIRVTGYYWLANPAKNPKLNVQAGLGLKFATGDYRYTDRFQTATPGVTIIGPVDQSIQLGDGGTGISTELNAYYMPSTQWSFYANFYYLLNPKEQNGTSTTRGAVPTAAQIAYTSDVMSVPDQMMIRTGTNWMLHRFTFSGGMRYECLPVNDLLGGSEGFRRPGNILSVEPGITYSFKKMSVYAYLPIAITRNRTQSVPDKLRTQITGIYAQGDAAFADYSLNIGFACRF